MSATVHSNRFGCLRYSLCICRDRSAAVTLKRVPVPGGKDGELMDEWLEFYHRPESEPEFPLRNEQVIHCKFSA